jgi:hypothetical protein
VPAAFIAADGVLFTTGKLTPTRTLTDQEVAEIFPFIKDIDWEDINMGVFDNSVLV